MEGQLISELRIFFVTVKTWKSWKTSSLQSHNWKVRGKFVAYKNFAILPINYYNIIIFFVNSGDLVSSGDVLEVLRPYCSESCHPTNTRKSLLQLMEKVKEHCKLHSQAFPTIK